MLAKVYLAKSGINCNGNGQRDENDLAKAAELAKDVIDNSGKKLMEKYEDISRVKTTTAMKASSDGDGPQIS